MGVHDFPSGTLRPVAYFEGFRYAHESDTPLCPRCLTDRGYSVLDAIHWLEGYKEGREAQGWTDPFDWRGTECRCGRPLK